MTDTATDVVAPEIRARASMRYEETQASLRELATESVTITDLRRDDDYAAAKAARDKLRSTRTTIEKTGKAARDDANAYAKAVIAAERELIGIIQPEEQRLASLIETERMRREEAARAVREAEQRRAEAVRQAFARVRSLATIANDVPISEIDTLIGEAERLREDPTHLPEDMRAAAIYEANCAIAGLESVKRRRMQEERDREELEQLRRERAEREERERRAQANAAEAARAAEVVKSNAARGFGAVEQVFDPDDDDVPPGVTPAPIPDSVQVPARKVVPLLRAARAALALLQARGLGAEPAARDLASAIEEADRHE